MGVVGMDPLFSGCLGSVRQKSQPMEQPCDHWHYEGDGNGDANDDDNDGEEGTGTVDDGDDDGSPGTTRGRADHPHRSPWQRSF